MRLLRAEVRRFAKRRLIRWTVGVFVLLLGLVLAGASYQSRPVTAAALATAQARAGTQLAEARAAHAERVAPCVDAVRQGRPPPPEFTADCDAAAAPSPDWYPVAEFLPYQLSFRDEVDGYLLLYGALLALVALLVGASFIGAEWSSGALANLLVWRPQRGRVLLTKLVVAVGAILALGTATAALWLGGVYAVARFDGTVQGTTAGLLQSAGLGAVRAVGLAALVGAFAFALASIGRHTAAAFGAVIGLALVSEVGMAFAGSVLRLRYPGAFQLSTYGQAWVTRSVTLDPVVCAMGATCRADARDITWLHALGVFGAGTVLALLVAFVVLRRRAIT
ncbi:hypothetical protein GCM10010124_22680 [Pilimelia terevasa]|uniref:Uncharacterized protein n=1 Tax=Pilimelia terevasa TaxID=53372 RepID=A0A8J3BMA1_9ACTN|nr:ABC transporter permease subunit [Pilimelia terevasa]GGK29363.1 hypothetical protein GCM10010124_22680 [Pilimelia terevasa]